MRLPSIRYACVAVVTASVLALPYPPPTAVAAPEPEGPEGQAQSLGAVLGRLQKLYADSESATDAYNTADEELKAQRKEVRSLDRRLTKARKNLTLSRRQAGLIAREQYQNAAFSPYVRLLLARDPQAALDQGQVLRRAAGNRAAAVERLAADTKRIGVLSGAGRKALDRQLTLAAKAKQRRTTVKQRLQDVEELLSSLSEEQLAALNEIQLADATEAQRELLDAGTLGDGANDDGKPPAPASRPGNRAVSYALDQRGKPYRAGSAGPKAYDASGLTQRAWRAAGRKLPRTAGGQWRELPHVSLKRLRPGDLVVYKPDAAHVALYLGDGRALESSPSGKKVRVVPVAARPLLGAVRPDGRK
ncbi:C40 family peptidase [Streptomyces sp. A7024]|uniref:C40 family peptidase n=1 Tax=Streptomyces coryli TaxID=1128680 RepID=A0A6G4U4X5_9ACTN|nr:C40 family peptidase [Streptomyces coryli]NGN66337.1 C40 family peptidase [Streptomyces coryli]